MTFIHGRTTTNGLNTGILMPRKSTNSDGLTDGSQAGIAQAVLDSLEDHIAVLDRSGRIVATNDSWDQFQDADAQGLLERPAVGVNYLKRLARLTAPGDKASDIVKNIRSVIRGERERFSMEIPSRSGTRKMWLLLSVTPLSSGDKISGAVVSYSDITARKVSEISAKRHSVTDQMTGILNRRAGLDSVRRQMKLCERHGCSFTVCYIDLDNLKLVNDSYGHKEGDKVIITIVKLIKSLLRESDVMCRLGGDELLLILHETAFEGSMAVLKRIIGAVEALNAKGRKPYRIEFSYGLAEYTLGSKLSPEELVDRADRDMYRMKTGRKSVKSAG